MTPIEQQIEKLAEKYGDFMDDCTDTNEGIKQNFRLAMRELIPLIREECAKIAEGFVDEDCVNDFYRAYNTACEAIAAAIREGK